MTGGRGRGRAAGAARRREAGQFHQRGLRLLAFAGIAVLVLNSKICFAAPAEGKAPRRRFVVDVEEVGGDGKLVVGQDALQAVRASGR